MKDIIANKRDKKALSKEEISFWIKGLVNGEIPDYQTTALLMAIVLNGMDLEETSILTYEMMKSGDILDLSSIKGIKVDKHSSGGVGDKVSLVLAPMVAACGAKVAKMSGRGLGHTGGTLDKLESIPGTSVTLTDKEFSTQVNKIGLAIMGQSANLVPADKKIYALRDTTATTASPALIASSIMSKKLATGSDGICLEITFGSGAIFATPEDAKLNAKTMIGLGKKLNRDVRAVLTSMDEPLGYAVGNNLEIKEAIDCLKGKGPKDVMEICYTIGSIMLVQAKVAKNYKEAKKLLKENLDNGNAFKKFKALVKAQGGDVSYIDNPSKFSVAKNVVPLYAGRDGYITSINTMEVGYTSGDLGAGRARKEDPVDFDAGIIFAKKIGDHVVKGDKILDIYTNHDTYYRELYRLGSAITISDNPCEKPKVVYEVLD